MLNTREHIQLNPDAVNRGYTSCRRAVRSFFRGKLWPAMNLPGDRRRALDAVLDNLIRSIDLLDLESGDGLSLDIWHEIRDDLSDAFQGRCTSVEIAALADASRRFNIPKQFLFDPLRGADLWIRNHQFDTFNELEAFCSYLGGSSLASAIPILGFIKPDYETAAIQTGKAIMLTQILVNCVDNMKQNKIFFAKEDLENCSVDVSRMKRRIPSPSIRHLVRLYGARIERWFHEGSHLVQYLDFDGQRTIKAILSWHWKMLMKMKAHPECLFDPNGVLSRREQLGLSSRHLMGLEQEIPIVVTEMNGH